MPEVAVIPLWTTRPSTRMGDAQGPPAQRPLVADAYLARPDRIAKPNKTRAHSGHPHRLGMLPVVSTVEGHDRRRLPGFGIVLL
jgi:hypothetical protein